MCSRSLLCVLILGLSASCVCADEPPESAGYTIPLIDLSQDAGRQTVVDREAGQYLGHPTTVLLEDGQTILCVYPQGHGRGGIVYKRSTDGGLTWSERLPVPESWATSKEVPTIHRVIGPDGTKRLIMWSGLYPARLATSEDDGESWSELKPAGGWGGIVVMGSVVELRDAPGHYLAMFHDDGRFFTSKDRRQSPVEFTLYQTESTDGGLTWSFPDAIWSGTDVHLCEPGIIRSPDGKQLCALLRENSRTRNSYAMFSHDEGATWSSPRELPAALSGDRHTGKYGPDGRLLISFRDTTRESATQGDWVAWVGRYDDIVNGREGQYRVRLMENHHRWDCAYPGVEVLRDGTFVCTTYGHWTKGEQPYIVSIRCTLKEIDQLAEGRREESHISDLFVSGDARYHTYRIPALLSTSAGTLLAFCEGRKTSRSDSGDIDLLVKRSSDNGRSWSDTTVVWDDGPNTCGNPCAVVDRSTGTIWLLMTHNLGADRESQIIDQTSEGTRTVWVSNSEDDGRTWTKPKNISAEVKQPNWTWYATGPGIGIQSRLGEHAGRLLIPCDHIEAKSKKYFSHVIYSDDHGVSWQLGGSSPADKLNECQLVELNDGRLMLNMRNYDRAERTRAVCESEDGGLTWTNLKRDAVLIEPICQASLIRLGEQQSAARTFLLFSNPASESSRENMTIRASLDDGIHWPFALRVWRGPSAYSCLSELSDGSIGLLFERGDQHPYEKISFARYAVEAITDTRAEEE